MILNVLSVKVTAFFNNIGTVTEIIGLVVIAIALYVVVIFGKGTTRLWACSSTRLRAPARARSSGYGSIFLAAMLTGAWVCTGSTPPAASPRRPSTRRARSRAPCCSRSASPPSSARSGWWRWCSPSRTSPRRRRRAPGAIAYIFDAHFPSWVTDVFLVSVCIAIFVCCLAIQAATSRLLFAYGRDKMIPGSKFFGYVHPGTKTPMASAIFVAAAAIVVLLYVNLGGSDPFLAIARVTAWATAGTYIAYQMVVFGGLMAGAKGWPKDKAYFNLGKWGWPVNIIAFVYGVFMIINLSWPRTPDAPWYDNCLVLVLAGRRAGRRAPWCTSSRRPAAST